MIAFEEQDMYLMSQRNMRISELPWLTIISTIGIGLLLAAFVLTLSTYFVLVAVLAIVAGVALVRNLQAGLVGYMLVAALAFGESPRIQSAHSDYGAGIMPSQLVLIFLFILWLGRRAFVERTPVVKSHLSRPLFVLLCTAIISLVSARLINPSYGLTMHRMFITQIAEIALMSCSVIAFVISSNVFQNGKYISAIWIPVSLLGIYCSAFSIVGKLPPVMVKWPALMINAAIGLVYARLLFKKSSIWAYLGLGLLLAFLIAGASLMALWISGFSATIVTILTITVVKSWRTALAVCLAAVLILMLFPGIYLNASDKAAAGGDFDRFIIWHDAITMLAGVNPYLGVGPGNYYSYIYHFSTIWYGINTYTTAHNNYVQILAELGIVGFMILLWVQISAVRTAIRNVRDATDDLKWLTIASLGILIGIFAACLFGDYLFPNRANGGIVSFGTTVYTWLILGAATAAGNLGRKQREAQE
jgi:O-antigen ligase